MQTYDGLMLTLVIQVTWEAVVGDISFTNDIWSNDARRPYVAMTAHLVAKDKERTALMLNACRKGWESQRLV
jgi:hypothetical protein